MGKWLFSWPGYIFVLGIAFTFGWFLAEYIKSI